MRLQPVTSNRNTFGPHHTNKQTKLRDTSNALNVFLSISFHNVSTGTLIAWLVGAFCIFFYAINVLLTKSSGTRTGTSSIGFDI